MNNVTALMPMKDHSERIPNKNISDFCGKPLYAWVMDSLISSEYIIQIIVNTDSEKVKDSISKRYSYNSKILVVDRPQYLLGDFVSINEIIRYDIGLSKTEHFLQTHATNPLLKTKTIDKAIKKYFENMPQYDSLLTVLKYNSRFYYPNGIPINHQINEMKRSQDEQMIYEENSNIFLFSKTSLDLNRSRIGKRPFFFEMNKLESTDINEKEDFKLAEILCRHLEIESI